MVVLSLRKRAILLTIIVGLSLIHIYNDIYRVKQGLTGFQKIKNSIWKNVMVRLIAGEKRKKSFDQFREKYLPLSDKSWNSKEKLMSNPPDRCV